MPTEAALLPGSPWPHKKNAKLHTFWYLFLLLRVSPSYELARRIQLGPLTQEDHESLPNDFEDVLKTYEILGDVYQVTFTKWWLGRGRHAIGQPVEPKVTRHAVLLAGAEMESYELKDLNALRRDDGWPDAMLLSVPLGMDRAKVLKQVGRVLDEVLEKYRQAGLSPEAPAPPARIQMQRTNTDKLVDTLGKGVRLLYQRAEYPGLSLLAFAKRTIPNRAGPKAKSKLRVDRDDSDNTLRTSANRELKKFERIAENAARGRYPSDQPICSAPYSPDTYRLIGERLKSIKRIA